MSDIPKFSKIVVAIDGSKNSLKAADNAIILAKKQNAKLVGVSVVKIPFLDPRIATDKKFVQFMKKHNEIAQEYLDSVKKKAEKNDVRFEPVLIEGDSSIPEEIINYTEKTGADLIVMGTRGQTGFKKALLGSVASAVASHAKCPVMVVR